MDWFNWPRFLLAVVLCEVAVVAWKARTDPAGYLPGDGTAYARGTESLWRDGDLDLVNQMFPGKTTIAEAAAELEGPLGEQFALSADGRMTLKHSPVMPTLAVPFFALFGDPGFVAFNVVVMTGLLAALAALAGGSGVAKLVVLAGYLTGPLPWYTFDFSPNVFATALLAGSMLAVRCGRAGVGGLLAGLAVGARVDFAPLLVPAAFLSAWEGGWKKGAAFVGGSAVGLSPVLAANVSLFGSPLINGYERQLEVGPGGAVGTSTHTSLFTLPFWPGVWNLLADPAVGIVRTAPLWNLWPAAAVVLLARSYPPAGGRPWAVAAVAVIALNLAVFAKFQCWNASTHGNRFLFPAETMGYVLIGAALSAVVDRWRAANPEDAA